MKAQIPWLRVFAEGVVIVGSILLAFGLQAWWEKISGKPAYTPLLLTWWAGAEESLGLE